VSTQYLQPASSLQPHVNTIGSLRGFPADVRLLSKLKHGKNGCWEFTGFKDADGYGKLQIGRRSIGAHRISWAAHRGEIPGGMCVLHKCDNPSCCNPLHLFLGTAAENMADRDAKGRQAKGDSVSMRLHPESKLWGDRNPARIHPEKLARGEKQGSAVLTESNVIAMRHKYAGGVRRSELASEFKCSWSAVDSVVSRRTWRHV
jgi:hypothetical protein